MAVTIRGFGSTDQESNMQNVSSAPAGTKGITHGRIRNASIRALQSGGMVVYAIRTGEGLIKFGSTSNLVERMKHIKGGTGELLAVNTGTRDDERAIHLMLVGKAALGREYYEPTADVMAVVNRMRAAINLPHIAA